MTRSYDKMDPVQHQQVLKDHILNDPKLFLKATPVDRPRAIITAGQPGAGKGNLVDAARFELGDNVVTIDPDQLREKHPQVEQLRNQHPYTWSGHTHGDASQWATELREAAVAQRKNIILDTTMPRADMIQELKALGYEVEVRAIATHRLESELGVDNRFTRDLDRFGHGRHVPEEVRSAVYKNLPSALDAVAQQTGVPIQIYDREGRLHFDSRTSPNASPGRALETARSGRLTQDRLDELHASTEAQRDWHRDMPDRVPNERVSPETAGNLLSERQAGGVEQGVQRLHNEVGGYRAVRPTLKAAGVLGTAYGAYDASNQINAAIDTARSSREQWVRGGEEAGNQTVKIAVTGTAATVGAVPGVAVGTLTSPVTGPVGPVVGGLTTGSVAAHGAEKLYEDSRLQQFSRYLGGKAGQLGYDYISKEGRLLRQINGLKEDLQNTSNTAERARLQNRLDTASAAFGLEAERNSRYFEGRETIENAWPEMNRRFPKLDKDNVVEAYDKRHEAQTSGKPYPQGKGWAVQGAFSDAVHERYPRALPHVPLEDYRSLSPEQMAEKHRQYAGEVVHDRRKLQALEADKDSHNNVDQGWPKALAQQRQADRVEEGKNELWRDMGHLGAIRNAYKERGLQPPELPAELRPISATRTSADTQGGESNRQPSTMHPTSPARLSPVSQQLLQDSEREVAQVTKRHGLAWDPGMQNTSAAVAATAREAGLSRVNLLRANAGQIHLAHYDGVQVRDAWVDAKVAANTPQEQSLQRMERVDRQLVSDTGAVHRPTAEVQPMARTEPAQNHRQEAKVM